LSKSRIPTHVEVQVGNGLTKNSVILTEQVRTLDKKKRILKITGHLDSLTMKKLNKAIKISVGEITPKTPLEKLPQDIQDEINETLQYIYSNEKVLEKSKSNNLNHLLFEGQCY
jgi:hypothetical protein